MSKAHRTQTDPGEHGRYFIATWGCQMNVHDSEKLSGILEGQGYSRAGTAAEADVVLLNTCSIREKASEKVFSELGRLYQLKQSRPDLILGVCGCVAQQAGEEIFRRAPYVDLVVGTRATASLPGMLRSLRDGEARADRPRLDTELRDDSIAFPHDEIQRQGTATGKAFVTVIEGCNHRCTYCIVPTTRGREICREMDGILDEVRDLTAKGVVEIEFLGQTVNAYRDGNGRTLADLLTSAKNVEGLRRIRFTTSHPAQMTDRLMDAMAEAAPVVCPYLHLPVQSGSSAVLKRMRRGYDREGYLAKIAGLRRRMPQMSFGTDVIVGFPGETESEFRETLSLLDEVQYDTIYSYVYSPRPGTAALQLGEDPPKEVGFERLRRLQETQQRIQGDLNRRWIGRDLEVLVEATSKLDPLKWSGRTPENRVVNFPGTSRPGSLEWVKVTGATSFSLRGELSRGYA
jgi:tRNA-2-methylthio-N6-dimethylallyladenosine synthase